MLFSDITKGIYQHINNKKFYEVIGTGRFIENPTKIVVLYKQLYDGALRGYNIPLPKGSMWIRDKNEFVEKFELIETNPALFNAKSYAKNIQFLKKLQKLEKMNKNKKSY
jgi:Protein of unknown function (DUF1653)